MGSDIFLVRTTRFQLHNNKEYCEKEIIRIIFNQLYLEKLSPKRIKNKIPYHIFCKKFEPYNIMKNCNETSLYLVEIRCVTKTGRIGETDPMGLYRITIITNQKTIFLL